MKKRLAIILTVVLVIGLSVAGVMFSKQTYAKEAQIHLEVPSSVKKENEFKIKVVLNSDVNLYSVDAYLSYNAEVMEFVPENDIVTGTAGVLQLRDTYAEETKKAEYELTFKALEVGKAEISLTDVYLIDYADLDYIEVVPSTKLFDIVVNKKEETDARLSDLMVTPGKLTEEFLPGKFEYEMHVGLDVEMLGVVPVPMEEDSVVTLDIPEKLELGKNVVTITVTSLSGKVNKYIITVYKEKLTEENTEVTEATTEAITETATENDTGTLTESITEEVSEAVTEAETESEPEATTEEITEEN